MKKFFLASSAAAMAAFGLIACGDETTINQITQDGIQKLAAGESLGKCSDKNVGEMFFVTDSSAVYYCADGKWKSLNGKDGDKGDKGESGSSSVDTLVMNNVDTVYVRDTVILNNSETPAKLDTIVLDNRDTVVLYNRDTIVSYAKDTVYVYDTTVVKYEPEYDTVTTAYLNQEMLADGKYGILVDKRDNKVYRTIEIGQQTWMAQNLDYSDGGITSYCFDNSLDSCAKYGRIYFWAAAMNLDNEYNATAAFGANGANSILYRPVQGVCPQGWHIPDTTEWGKLRNWIQAMNLTSLHDEKAGTSMKSVVAEAGWLVGKGTSEGTDRYGFSALPSGRFNENKKFDLLHEDALWWTTTEYSATSAYRANVFSTSDTLKTASASKKLGRSVRCLKNAD